MKSVDIIYSMVAHTAVIGAFWIANRTVVVEADPIIEEPICFELMENLDRLEGREKPEDPAKSEDPEKPEIPEELATPEEPGIPDEPEKPAKSDVPGKPDEPEAPEKMDRPEEPVKPEEPERPDGLDDLDNQEDRDKLERAAVVSEPKALNRITPRYPRSARRNRREGAVTVEFSVSSSGKVESAEVVASSGCRELDEAALESVRQAVFAPATEDGVAVSATLRLTFEFRLK